MVIDGLKAYVQLASGLTDVTRERAVAAARAIVAQGEAVGVVVPDAMRVQVASVTEDLIATSKANRDLMVGLVRAEVERSVSRLGLVSAAELSSATRRAEALDDRVHELERALRSARGGRPAAKKSATKKSATKKSAAKKSAKKSATKKSAAKTANKAATKKSAAKKSAGKKSAAKKTPGTRTSG